MCPSATGVSDCSAGLSRLVDVEREAEDGHQLVTVATPLRLRGGGSPPAVLGALVAMLDVQTRMGHRALPYLKADLRTLADTLAPHVAEAARTITARLAAHRLTCISSSPAACPPPGDAAGAGVGRACKEGHSRCSAAHPVCHTLLAVHPALAQGRLGRCCALPACFSGLGAQVVVWG